MITLTSTLTPTLASILNPSMRFTYSFAIRIYGLFIYFAQFFSKKASQWVLGRQNWQKQLVDFSQGKPIIWIHVASHGEFEQGKSVIDGLYENCPDHRILLTFFSPSGYELLKNYPKAHKVAYLPLDTQKNARDFVKIVKPQAALFVKYEFWYNYLQACFLSRVPVVFFSASFRESHIFFKPSGKWFLAHLKSCEHFFVRDQQSALLLKQAGVNQCTVAGDTRFDSVIENTKKGEAVPEVAKFVGTNKAVIFGSTWPEDEQVILPWINEQREDLKLVVAPHEINKAKIIAFRQKVKVKTALYSEGHFENAQMLILDCVGILKRLYRYSTVNYVGGGFGSGIHNLLEPSSFGKPVIFGPRNQKFVEAKELINLGAGHEIKDASTFSGKMNDLLMQSEQWDETTLKNYFSDNSGAGTKVQKYVEQMLKPNL